VRDFLGLLPCRSLEGLSLDLEGEKELDKPYLFDIPSEFPRLMNVDLTITVGSWQSLHYLEVFTSLPIHVLKLYCGHWRHLSSPYDQVVIRRISFSKESRAPITQQLVFPRLTEFSFDGAENGFIYLLSLLEVPQLGILKADIEEGKWFRSWDREEALQALATKSIASVQIAHLDFFWVDQPSWYLGLFPNLHELRIDIHKSTRDDMILFLISDVILPLCDAIATGSFPYLWSIHAECNAIQYGNMQTIEWSDEATEEVHRIVQDMLVRLAKAGGLALQMEPLIFDCHIHSEDTSSEAQVTFEARASPSDPHLRIHM